MPIKFSPDYTITAKIAKSLMRIEAVRERVLHLKYVKRFGCKHCAPTETLVTKADLVSGKFPG